MNHEASREPEREHVDEDLVIAIYRAKAAALEADVRRLWGANSMIRISETWR